jgi:hypothetical protein
MTSVSMVLAGLNATTPAGQVVTPGTLNQFLEDHNGYTCIDGDCNNLVLAAPDQLTPRLKLVGEMEKPSLKDMQAQVASGTRAFIAHVRDRSHFVLVTGWDAAQSAFTVNDPFYPSTTYTYDDIADVIIYELRAEAPVSWPTEPAVTAIIPKEYPLYKQCNSTWGNNLIKTETICAVGCLMSSTSMALGGHHIPVGNRIADPGTLNEWLRNNGGYTSGNDLIESMVPKVAPKYVSWPSDAMHVHNDLPKSAIQGYLKSGRPVIANVMQGRHFVLVTGWDVSNDDTLYINDPGFTRSTYSYSDDVVGWRLFDMKDE